VVAVVLGLKDIHPYDVSEGVLRMLAAFVRFALCLPYLCFFPVHSMGVTALIDPRVCVDRGRAIVDSFRVENGRAVEHWDVIQDVPGKTVGDNTIF
jgi:hypothetical protein